jgi:ribosomal protein L3 glutamine methyltransferase
MIQDKSDQPDHTGEQQDATSIIRGCAARLSDAGLHFGHGTDNAYDEAAHLVLHVLSLDPGCDEKSLRMPVSRSNKKAINELVKKRIDTRRPAAYLTGKTWFAGLEFLVDERVLVPRSPIAELIGDRYQPWIADDNVDRILDLCTGSGCIAIASAMAFPRAQVDGSDISADALDLARSNVSLHKLDERVRLIESDLFANLAGKKYDIIVSNPPYVSIAEHAELPDEYHCEPDLGLLAGNDGLDMVRTILVEARQYLNDSGILVVEVGATQALLEHAYPHVPFTWLELRRGGSGVFVMSADELDEYAPHFG